MIESRSSCMVRPEERTVPLRQIKAYSEEEAAHSLADYLEVQGVENQVRPGQAGFSVWVIHDDQRERAISLMQDWSPEDGQEQKRRAAQIRKQRDKARRPVATPRIMGRDSQPTAWGAGVLLLVAGCGLVALMSGLGARPPLGLYIAPLDLSRGRFLPLDWLQPWRLVSPIFIHFGFMHLLFNMMWLRQLGGVIEEREGTVRLLFIVGVSAALSNLGQYFLRGPNFGGMSGVNYGLFAYAWMQARYHPAAGYRISSSTTWWMMGWLVLCGTGALGPVANVAHAGGLIVGIALGFPEFVRFVRSHNIKTAFAKGSWEDMNVKGWARWRRLAIEPYLPLWFLAVAFVVAYADS